MHIVNGVLRTEVSKEIIYTEEYCVHWNSWLIRLCATASRSMGGKKCLFVITLHICRISDCGLEGLISHGEFLNLCCVVMRLLSQPTKPQRRQQFVCSDQSKWSRRGPEGLPVRPEEGVCCWWGSGSGRRRGLCARQMVRQVWRRVCRQTPESLCVWIEASCGRDASEESEFQFSHIHSRFVFSIFCVRVTTSTICHTASHSTAALFLWITPWCVHKQAAVLVQEFCICIFLYARVTAR